MNSAQTGPLDPLNGMFWTWASGYVMAKLEVHSPVSTINNQAFTYHIGGYQSPYIAIRSIEFPLPLEDMLITKDTTVTISINADINTWFSKKHPIPIAENPACHSPSQLAIDIADNYQDMFSIKEVY